MAESNQIQQITVCYCTEDCTIHEQFESNRIKGLSVMDCDRRTETLQQHILCLNTVFHRYKNAQGSTPGPRGHYTSLLMQLLYNNSSDSTKHNTAELLKQVISKMLYL